MIGVLESYLLHSQIVDFWRKRQILTLVTCADRGEWGVKNGKKNADLILEWSFIAKVKSTLSFVLFCRIQNLIKMFFEIV